jgi:hypothetical protein
MWPRSAAAAAVVAAAACALLLLHGTGALTHIADAAAGFAIRNLQV